MISVPTDQIIELCINKEKDAIMKYNRYYPDYQARKVFDDLLGFRSLCDNYDDVLDLRRS